MTNEQFSKIAHITLANSMVISDMAGTLYALVEAARELTPNARLIPLLSAVEQLQASIAPLKSLAEQVQRELGV